MAILESYDGLTARLRAAGDYVWPLALRLIMFWEFWEAGITKFRGSNWFSDIPWAGWQKGFPWPFKLLPTDLNWFLATWGELVFAFLILFGLFTRFAAFSLIVITMVATAAVHWPAEWSGLGGLWEGYLITAKGGGNFK
ncbi:MAG: DoxX family membrane protein, partial [Xanthomonadales bacterium]|nr:DoxX family protein [Xanthomonadales bacterium]NIX12764.1 DoxX family membrane protein [Xanthomonadales bacterium]